MNAINPRVAPSGTVRNWPVGKSVLPRRPNFHCGNPWTLLCVFVVGTIVYPIIVVPAAALIASLIVALTSAFGLFFTWIYWYFKSCPP